MTYQPTWASLRNHPTPEWFREAKFGVYTHWGIYSVPAFGPNGSWYPSFMYTQGTAQYNHHVKTYGGPEKFGYKDFLPRYAGLYGEVHDTHLPPTTGERDWDAQMPPSRAFLDLWARKILEVDEAYRPDLIWFDFGLHLIPETERRVLVAGYYNRAAAQGRDVVFCYKNHDAVPGSGIVDIELGGAPDLHYHEWITDTTAYRTPTSLIHYLIDNISKNGALLLNVGPRPDGSIPEPAVEILEEMGRWLGVHGEAVYGTIPWVRWGSGPTKPSRSGPFTDLDGVEFTADDFRFTAAQDAVYAHQLGKPEGTVRIPGVANELRGRIRGVELLGRGTAVWSVEGDGLKVEVPTGAPFRHAAVWKIRIAGEAP